jgi:hypothetical protein
VRDDLVEKMRRALSMIRLGEDIQTGFQLAD